MHATVLVVTEKDTYEAVEEALAPFDEEWGKNEEGQWDWWVIGGRWENYPLIRYDGSTALTVRRDELDLEAMTERWAGDKGYDPERWPVWQPLSLVVNGEWHSSEMRWNEYCREKGIDPECARDEVRDWWDDPIVKAHEASWNVRWLHALHGVPGYHYLTLVDYHY